MSGGETNRARGSSNRRSQPMATGKARELLRGIRSEESEGAVAALGLGAPCLRALYAIRPRRCSMATVWSYISSNVMPRPPPLAVPLLSRATRTSFPYRGTSQEQRIVRHGLARTALSGNTTCRQHGGNGPGGKKYGQTPSRGCAEPPPAVTTSVQARSLIRGGSIHG